VNFAPPSRADNNIADFMRNSEKGDSLMKWWLNRPPSFTATSDTSGVALLMNLPREANRFSVTYSNFVLPAKDDGSRSKLACPSGMNLPGCGNCDRCCARGRALSGDSNKKHYAKMTLSLGLTNRLAVQLEPGRAPIGHY
jgi:hypothetical protein